MIDQEYAKRLEGLLTKILLGAQYPDLSHDEYGTSPEVNTVETFEEYGLLARDRGLVVKMSDDAQVRLTIVADTPTGELR